MTASPDPILAPLAAEAKRLSARSIADLFADDSARFDEFTWSLDGLTLDLSKQRLDGAALESLAAFAAGRGLEDWRTRFFAGEDVNATEGRPALHMALRARPEDGLPFADEVAAERSRQAAFAQAVKSGDKRGSTGRRLRHIVHLGIGGSDLGPRLVHAALKRFCDPQIDVRFAANIDPADINDALEGLDPEATLVVVVSKSFSTEETLQNALAARAWLAEHLQDASAAGRHVVAITARPDRAQEFGVAEDAVFGFEDWVGGRYSLWSAVGLSLQIALEDGAWEAMLDGARAMDRHFAEAPLKENLPVLKALTDLLNAQGFGYATRCVAPYASRLGLLPAFLQQLEMESLGKHAGLDGGLAAGSHPVVWGEPGTNAQHAFFQQIHQGHFIIPVDFIAPVEGGEARPDMQTRLLANCVAQSEALMRGRSLEDVRAEMAAAGEDEAEIARIAPHRVCPGDRPSTTILLERLDPARLGLLLALYEHKTAVEGALRGINTFDQFGVELGKQLAGGTLPALKGEGAADPASAGLVAAIREAQKGA